jgi:recombinational DNA repair protein RecR
MVELEKLFENYFLAAKETVKTRMDICNECPHLTKKKRCKECGCFMNVKAKLSLTRCPIGRW